MTNKRIILTGKGDPTMLQMAEDDMPVPNDNEIRIKVLAVGVAFADVLMRRGKYPNVPKFPFTPGYDIVGEVDVCGRTVSDFRTGQRVAALTVTGGYTQYICLPAEDVSVVPDGVHTIEAACLPLNYVTAYQLLHRVAKVCEGQQILIHGAAGGVGTALIELGSLAGLTMYGTASPRKHDFIKELGAFPLSYQNQDWIQDMVQHGGMDAVFDPVGGKHFWESAQTVRRGGHLAAFGSSSIMERDGVMLLDWAYQLITIHLWNYLPHGKSASFYDIRQFKNKQPLWYRQDLEALMQLLAQGKIKPCVAAALPLDDIRDAHTMLEQSQVMGKIIIQPNV
jgi:NADPH:quinone reductase-like Zn-dependent oxidoreductase